MSDLTPANRALMDSDPQMDLGAKIGCVFTPSRIQIVDYIVKSTEALVMAEEYEHPILSRAAAVRQAKADLDLGYRALKASLIVTIKCVRGEWRAIA